MGRGVTRVTRALAVALLAGAATASAQTPIYILDERVPELSSGGLVGRAFMVRLIAPAPGPGNITVNWTTVPGSAKDAPPVTRDFAAAGGTVTFFPGQDAQPILVPINEDTVNEWNPTFPKDEVFFIELSNPSANAVIQRGRATITLRDDDRPMPPGVQFLSATSGGSLPPDTNKLQWRIPDAPVPPDNVGISWNTGAGCNSPILVTGGVGSMYLGFAGAPGSIQIWPHATTTPGLQYCYSVFAIYSGTPTPEVAQVKATPFDTSAGPVAWRYSPGCYSTSPCASAALAPPTVGWDAIYAVGNDGIVHAIQRGPLGGARPSSWQPVAVGRPTQNRSAVVPMKTVPVYADWRLFLGTDGGGVHALDAQDGDVIWSRSTDFGGVLPNVGVAQAQPAGIFQSFAGLHDMLLVGTNSGLGNNSFFALNPATGADVGLPFFRANMGDVRGMAVVDYPGNRVFFLTAEPTTTLFALDLGPAGTPGLSLSTLPVPLPNPIGFVSGTSGSAVLRNNRLIFGDSNDRIFAVNLLDGNIYSSSTGDGQVKGFVWPDRRNNNLYFSTDNKVHAVEDLGGSFNPLWEAGSISGLSMVLQKPGTDYLYVGASAGRLIQINVTTQAQTPLVLDATSVQIGTPSLDGGHSLVIVGSSTGTIHAVRVGVPYI